MPRTIHNSQDYPTIYKGLSKKFTFSYPVKDQIFILIELSERRLLELRYDTAAARQFIDLASLPQSDPFDIALIAQAITKKMTLITSDHHILASTVSGLHSLDAEK